MLRSSFGDSEEEPPFVFPPSPNLFCPICHELFKNPIITKECGHSFCELCLFQVDNSLCPLCRRKVHLPDAHQNLVLDQLVKELPVYCRYKKSGCNEQLPLVSRGIHEKQCKFGPSPCPHSRRGCPFQGSKQELEEHIKQKCGYEMVKVFIQDTEEHISSLKQKLEFQSAEIRDLRKKISELESNNRTSSISLKQEENSKKKDNSSSFSNITSSDERKSLRSSLNTIPISNSPPLSEKDRWDIPGMQCQQTLAGHTRGVTSIAYCPITEYLFTGSHDTTIKVWDLTKPMTDDTSSNSLSISSTPAIQSTINSSSNYLFGNIPTTSSNSISSANSTSTAPTVGNTFRCIKTLEGHKYTVWCLVTSEDGKYLFSSGSDGVIICWDNETFEQKKTFAGTTGKIYSLKLHGSNLYSAGADRKIRVWDINTFQCLKELIGHTDSIWQLVYSDNLLYSGSDDKTIKVWDLESYDCVYTVIQTQHQSKILSLAVGSGFICIGTDDCKIKIWSSETYEFLKELTDHSWEVWQLCIHDGLLFSGSFDHTIKVWDCQSFTCLKTLTGHKGYVHALTLGNNYRVFSGSGDKTIKIWRGFG